MLAPGGPQGPQGPQGPPGAPRGPQGSGPQVGPPEVFPSSGPDVQSLTGNICPNSL